MRAPLVAPVAVATVFVAPGGRGFGGYNLLRRGYHSSNAAKHMARTMMEVRSIERKTFRDARRQKLGPERAPGRLHSRPRDGTGKFGEQRARTLLTLRAD